MRAKIAVVLLSAGFVAGCANPNAIFVETTGGISVGAEPKDAGVQVGYKRRERYVAPTYTDTGAVPPVIAGFVSGGSVFAPEVNQTLATGSAESVTFRPRCTAASEPSSSPRTTCS